MQIFFKTVQYFDDKYILLYLINSLKCLKVLQQSRFVHLLVGLLWRVGYGSGLDHSGSTTLGIWENFPFRENGLSIYFFRKNVCEITRLFLLPRKQFILEKQKKCSGCSNFPLPNTSFRENSLKTNIFEKSLAKTNMSTKWFLSSTFFWQVVIFCKKFKEKSTFVNFRFNHSIFYW